MPRYTSQEIDEIADTIRSGRDRNKPAHILIGAGCSKSAGIPLSNEIVAEIHKRYPSYGHRLPESERGKYGACMKLLAPNQRRDLLAPYLSEARINWAHIAIAQLMCQKFVERVLTVNFDNLLARACGLLDLYPAIYDFASAPTNDLALIVSPAIVHLHGQGHGVVLLNTEEETRNHAAKISPVLRQSMDHPLVVIGYSGDADDVLRLLREYYPDSEHLYWLSHGDEAAKAVAQLAEERGYFKCLNGVDADRFLIELAQKLACWPPAICNDPIGHLLGEFAPVADYPTVPDSKIDILSTTRTRLEDLRRVEQEQRGTTEQIEKYLFGGQYREAFEAFKRQKEKGLPTDTQRDLACEALLLQGGECFDQASGAVDPTAAASLFEQAGAMCEEVLRIKSDNHLALYNWGLTLAGRARRASDPAAADALFKQAEGKYEEALRIKPDSHEALNNWGIALAERARRATEPAAADALFKQAEGKYEEALRIKPDKHEALNNWGLTLAERARRAAEPAAADALFKQAEGKYEEALRIKPDSHEALNNWGNALAERARQATDPAAADGLFKQAEGKYEEALRIKPDKHEALNNWGIALAGQARQATDPAAADALFKQAEGKYEEALRIKPDSHQVQGSLGDILLERAKIAGDSPAAEIIWQKAESRLMEAIKYSPANAYNLACLSALRGRADNCRKYLETAEQAAKLPNISHLQSDDDLKVVRNEPWFLALIDRRRRQEERPTKKRTTPPLPARAPAGD